MSTPTLSVAIPVKNGARYLAEMLSTLAEQDDEIAEVLVIDSGSTDGSQKIVRWSQADLLEIAAGDFGHGRTRNLAFERTRGDLICFITQDATPVPGWAGAYRDVMASGERIGAAYGPHLPRPDTSPMIARELTEFFATFETGEEPVLQGPDGPTFLSNVNACYRRACWEEIRFAEVAYSEDQRFGAQMLEDGWLKAYVPAAGVLHAHDYGPVEFMRRYFDEYRGLRDTIGHIEAFELKASAGQVRRLVAADRRWMREHGYPARERARWTARSLIHHSGRKVFSALGSRADRLPAALRRQISLEGSDHAPA